MVRAETTMIPLNPWGGTRASHHIDAKRPFSFLCLVLNLVTMHDMLHTT